MALTILQNIGLTDPQSSEVTSNINEPTAATNDRQLFMTGNWFASRSSDGGANWTLVDPFTSFPASAGGFCCDQVVLFNPKFRIWIWLLQYSSAANGENIFRVSVSREATFGNWYYWDFAPRNLNATWTANWFDYPDMAFTSEQLFITFNMFKGNDWQRAVVFRMPLTTLASAGTLSYRWWQTTSNGSLRLSRGAASTMYMASHNSVNQIRVLQWADSAATVTTTDVNVRPWLGGAYSAPGPGGSNWLGRCDSRITGACVGGDVLTFMWSANRDGSHPLPYIRVVRLRETTKALVAEPDLWSQSSAWAYPAAASNAQGVVGLSAFYGGGTRHPWHVVGTLSAANNWSTAVSATSTHSPPSGAWGDYVSCVPHQPASAQWVASGYTLRGGTDRRNIEPRYVRFRA
ncbi:hypothetical protein [Variovorax sp. J22R115]|uniref:hypothetical protein n=1 Tax=Variovorax sp. J22R115 TaxID=3053509 RepID=UPI002574FC23|nr:hypothetical protein [Variovorax sp. J22R115]MDM0053015.1 hypothetical protein [Variovorax sp. J22R115]